MPEIIQVSAMTITFLRSKDDTGGALDMFEMIAPPNERMPVPHYHRDWEETVYGLEGVLTFNVDGTPFEIGPGDSVFVPRGVIHGFNNFGTVPARCLSVLTPGVLGPAYFREMGAALAGGGPPDPARLGEIMTRHGLVPAPPR